MTHRTFGWVQDASDFYGLRAVCGLFVKGSDTSTHLIHDTLPLLKRNGRLDNLGVFQSYIHHISQTERISIPYPDLVGKGQGSGKRSEAPCSGLAQAVLTAQTSDVYITPEGLVKMKRPYQSNWSAEAFLRWAVSIGLLLYDGQTDSCTLSEIGYRLVEAREEEALYSIIGEVLLAYPPVIRILTLLEGLPEGRTYTKFELGNQLGFIGEDGFTSYPLNLWLADYNTAPESRRKGMKANVEGTSDKYARMICGWLIKLKWVNRCSQSVSAIYNGETYSAVLPTYSITLQGRNQLRYSRGFSRHPRIHKIVLYGMLGTKTIDVNRVRARRAELIKAIEKPHSIEDLSTMLTKKGYEEANEATVQNDVAGLINIGLEVETSQGQFNLADHIHGLVIPSVVERPEDISDLVAKSRLMQEIPHVSKKYLTLIDLAVGGRDESQKFEMLTTDLLTNELEYGGKHLGGTSKPDNIIYYKQHGAIIDNKAYSKGFVLSRHQKDEMLRYLDDNATRDSSVNSTEWWNNFPLEVNSFCFLFISSFFKGAIDESISEIAQRKGVNGAALPVTVLLYMAESLKTGKISYEDSFSRFAMNRQLTRDDFEGSNK